MRAPINLPLCESMTSKEPEKSMILRASPVLIAGGARGVETGADPTLVIGKGTQQVRLRLKLRENAYRSYQLVLQAVGGGEVFSRRNVKPRTDRSGASFILTLPVALSTGRNLVKFEAGVDTGASFCIFERGYGEALGLDVEAGMLTHVRTVTGSFDAYGHMLTLSTLGYSFDVIVYFAKDENFGRNVLGRRGWLDQVRLGLVDYESKLYISKYGD